MCAGFRVVESGNVLLSQVFPHVLDPPLAAHMGEPNQVHSLTSSETTGEMDVTDAQSFFRAFPPTLPGDIVPLFRPQGAGDDILTKYNVAH